MYYGIVMLLSVLIVSFIMKGFFMKFLKVKMSFGRLLMVKLRAVNRDYYAVGKIEDGFLIYKSSGGTKRLAIPDGTVFYRSLGVAFIDIDDTKNAIVKWDLTAISGYDPVKYEELYKRCLYKPGIKDQTTKIIIGGLFLILVAVGIVAFLVYKQGLQIESIGPLINSQISAVKGVIAGGNV